MAAFLDMRSYLSNVEKGAEHFDYHDGRLKTWREAANHWVESLCPKERLVANALTTDLIRLEQCQHGIDPRLVVWQVLKLREAITNRGSRSPSAGAPGDGSS